MTVHFAAARLSASTPVIRAFATAVPGPAANDNTIATAADDQLLHAALRHFAEHGLGAARAARAQAERAFFTGDRPSYDWWLGICRTLDRRLASELAKQIGARRRKDGPSAAW